MDREEHTGLKNFASIVFFLALIAGLYFVYRYQRNPSAADLRGVYDLSALSSSKCTVSSGSFLGASGGHIYVHKGMIREDLVVIEGGEQKQVHRLFTDENNGTMYVWFDGDTDGIMISDIYSKGGFSVADGSVVCKPWWIANGNAFLLPYDVIFKPAQ